jgi:formate hydrogenlyase subunit 5
MMLPSTRWPFEMPGEELAPQHFGEEVAQRALDGHLLLLTQVVLEGTAVRLALVAGGRPSRVEVLWCPGPFSRVTRPSWYGLWASAGEEEACGPDWAQPPAPLPWEMTAQARGAFIFPLGPIRADVSESVALRLTAVGDEVVSARVVLGYKKRHVLASMEGREASSAAAQAELATATSTVAHALAASQAVEDALGVDIPARARVLRVWLAEWERLHSHLLVLGTLAAATGLPVAQQELLLLRERVLRTVQAVSGSRYLRGLVRPGGLAADPGDEQVGRLVRQLPDVRRSIEQVAQELLGSSSFLDRLVGAGPLGSEEVFRLQPVGYVGRSAGRLLDVRGDAPYAAYAQLFQGPAAPEAGQNGDSLARFEVLLAEVKASLDLLEASASRLPYGPVQEVLPQPGGNRMRWGLGRVEGPRGELVYLLGLDGQGKVQVARARTASGRNWPLLAVALAHRSVLQDVPIVDASFSLSAAGADL